MTKIVRDGTGILSGEFDTEEIEKRAEAERKLEQAAAEKAAEEEALLNLLEDSLTKSLRNELAEEIADRKLSAKTLAQYRESFLKFKEYCRHWSAPLPHLPASPQVVAAFLASEIHLGKAHVRRLAKIIATAHRSADLPNPAKTSSSRQSFDAPVSHSHRRISRPTKKKET
jgi:hypothetical protein